MTSATDNREAIGNLRKLIDTTDYMIQVSRGLIHGASIRHVFGRNDSIGSGIVPISNGSIYRTPIGTVTLEAISSNAGDTAGGVGARVIEIEYLDVNWITQKANITMNGLTPTTETISGIRRLFFARVLESGAYASQLASSHLGELTMRVVGGGDIWATIPVIGGFGLGATQIGATTIPAGKTGYLLKTGLSIKSNQAVNLYLFKRERSNIIAAPFSAMEIVSIFEGATGVINFRHETMEPLPEYTDVGFLGNDTSGSSASVEFELLLMDNN